MLRCARCLLPYILQSLGSILTLITTRNGKSTSDTAASLILKEAIAQINRTLPAYKHINRFEIRHEDFEKTLTKKIKRFLVK